MADLGGRDTPLTATRVQALRTIAIVNQKGGCGKTTTAINLAAVYATRGLRTLLVDIDPQAHCAAGLGVPERRIEYSIADAMRATKIDAETLSALIWEVARGLHLAPSTMNLAALEAPEGGLHALPDRDRRLQRVLEWLAPDYDRCLIDCPPTIGLLTFNALRAARETLIPVETGYFALRGAERQWETIQRVITRIGRPIACHLLPSLHDPESDLARDILTALRRQFAGQILPLVIHEHHELRLAASVGQAVIEFAPDSDARREFEALADWLEEHAARPTVEITVVDRPPPTPPLIPRVLNARPTAVTAAVAAPLAPAAAATEGGGRAAELVGRLRSTGEPVPVPRAEVAPSPRIPMPMRPQLPAGPPAYGAMSTISGVLFVQPGFSTGAISVAGDFNRWSPTATPLRLNVATGAHEALVKMRPGRHRYRLVVGGRWQPDQYNDDHEVNEHGETNSVVTVLEPSIIGSGP